MRPLVVVVMLVLIGALTTPYLQAQTVEKVTAEQLQAKIAESEAAVKVVNFWATWCAPCIEEMPYFMQLGKDLADQGVVVFFVSMDFEDEAALVESFLEKQEWEVASMLRTGKDNHFISTLHEDWSGVVPATMLYGQDGSPLDFWQGKPVGYDDLKARVLQSLHP
jgi:thiol-disulfide isomerase/thioredoxin